MVIAPENGRVHSSAHSGFDSCRTRQHYFNSTGETSASFKLKVKIQLALAGISSENHRLPRQTIFIPGYRFDVAENKFNYLTYLFNNLTSLYDIKLC